VNKPTKVIKMRASWELGRCRFNETLVPNVEMAIVIPLAPSLQSDVFQSTHFSINLRPEFTGAMRLYSGSQRVHHVLYSAYTLDIIVSAGPDCKLSSSILGMRPAVVYLAPK